MQWGSIDFHRRSLENLNEAMRRTRKLCAIMLDTVGRELIVERGAHLDETGWPIHDSNVSIAPNSKVGLCCGEGSSILQSHYAPVLQWPEAVTVTGHPCDQRLPGLGLESLLCWPILPALDLWCSPNPR